MKDKYNKPELDIIAINKEDILLASGEEGWTEDVTECTEDQEFWGN